MISDENHLDNEISIEKHIFRQNDYPGRLIKRIIEENVTFPTVTRLNLFKVIYHNNVAKPNLERTDHCFKGRFFYILMWTHCHTKEISPKEMRIITVVVEYFKIPNHPHKASVT